MQPFINPTTFTKTFYTPFVVCTGMYAHLHVTIQQYNASKTKSSKIKLSMPMHLARRPSPVTSYIWLLYCQLVRRCCKELGRVCIVWPNQDPQMQRSPEFAAAAYQKHTSRADE